MSPTGTTELPHTAMSMPEIKSRSEERLRRAANYPTSPAIAAMARLERAQPAPKAK